MTRGEFETLYVNYNGIIINDEKEKQEILNKYLKDKKVYLYVDFDMHKLEIVSFAELFSKRLRYKKEYPNDEEFKKIIVNLCETSSDKTMSDIAREYGVSRTNITNWRKNMEL